jgi:hypothetical protein
MAIVLAGIDIVVEAVTESLAAGHWHSDIMLSQCRALAALDLSGLGAILRYYCSVGEHLMLER